MTFCKTWISLEGETIEAFASAVRLTDEQITLDFRKAPGEINAIASGKKYEITEKEAFRLLTAKSSSTSAKAKFAGSDDWVIIDPFEAAAYRLKDDKPENEGIGIDIVDRIGGDDEIVLQPDGKMQISKNLIDKEIKIQCLVRHERWMTMMEEDLNQFTIHAITLPEDKSEFIYQTFIVEPVPHQDLSKASLRRVRAKILDTRSIHLFPASVALTEVERSPKIESWRLDFLSCDFKLIFPSDIPLCRHSLIRGYHLELRKAIEGMDVYPLSESDLNIYPDFSPYYQKVMDLVSPGVDCDDLESESRHKFFVCGGLATDKNGQQRLELSGLEQLMGYSYLEQDEDADESDEEPITTGDTALDVVADITLIFKSNAKWMISTYGIDELARIARQANARMQDPSERSEVVQVENSLFKKHKKQILLKLSELAITTPTGF